MRLASTEAERLEFVLSRLLVKLLTLLASKSPGVQPKVLQQVTSWPARRVPLFRALQLPPSASLLCTAPLRCVACEI